MLPAIVFFLISYVYFDPATVIVGIHSLFPFVYVCLKLLAVYYFSASDPPSLVPRLERKGRGPRYRYRYNITPIL